MHCYICIVRVFSAKVLEDFHLHYKLHILLKTHISPLFYHEIKNKEAAEMTGFPRLFFQSKPSCRNLKIDNLPFSFCTDNSYVKRLHRVLCRS